MATGTSPESQPRVSVEHIEIDERGSAKLVGQRIKVTHIIALMQAHGYTAEQLQAEAYPHLSLAQVYSALAYYYDHQSDIDRQIKEDDESYDRSWREQQSDPKHQELVARIRNRSRSADESARNKHG